ncbi:Uncharacterised protein [uncultured archaeon]|nr:Uncharacterised protein [uncultured archaeon]
MFLKSEKAVTEVIGQLIILSLTITGVSMISVVGVPSIMNLEDTVNVRNLEQTYTMIDSHATRAIIGNSPLQKVDVNLGGGSLAVEPNGTGRESYITIKSTNNTINIKIPMGRVKYQLGDRIVAYEGGGIFSKYPSGGSVMLSPPELNYNGVTLTLPVVNMSGNSSVGGDGAGSVSFKKSAVKVLYPNTSIDRNWTNPVNSSNEKLVLNISSDYYDAWADFAQTMINANVSSNPNTKTTSMQLNVLPPMGTYPIGQPVKIVHLNTSNSTPMSDFSVYLKDENNHNNVANLGWEIYATKGNSTFNLKLDKDGNDFIVKIEYETPAGEEEWNGVVLPGPPSQWQNSVNVNFLNKTLNLSYDPDEGQCLTYGGGCTSGTKKSLYDLVQHYMVLMGPDITFYTDEVDHVDLTASSITVKYDTGDGSIILYLFVTENDVDVGLK